MIRYLATAAMFFFIYAFLGWCSEVTFATFKTRTFVNRGFLKGPICPIYGVGLTCVVYLLEPIQSFWLQCLGAAVLTTFLELVTGWAMEKLFHHRWWDYSKMPLNIGGYVCLPFSVLWGIVCVLIIRLVHEPLSYLVGLLPSWALYILVGVFTVLLLVDLISTVAMLNKLNSHLAKLDALSKELKKLSDALGQNIYSGAIVAARKSDKILEGSKPQLDELKAKADAAKDKMNTEKSKATQMLSAYQQMSLERFKDYRRLMKAFPSLTATRYKETLESKKNAINEWLTNHKSK